ncbi:PEP-CTERM sorting domain-containing protein [Massilia antarctica]|uniref:PEP-CTERM sorting domain-containing protein n=1 Tax=Massilia antarctica TaxID=2765360 RepID=UPI0006BE11E6|nr:PEP-CTERM sorting domain-containing protein [Massilia sp. H27-R4]MCY0914222.1 PEP-CTERM sorting domain-containing protein [Massilia sp. H27-R4]CUI08632.1 hypothetical protein BN2497_12041 [Janthinobacterium sp. CG23_2]CUU32418.1 hypothetical protein BN3177_12041 [Janthinobacterium sp. CG23_2]
MCEKRLHGCAALLLALGMACAPARAALVADTGTPANAVGAGWAFNSEHSYAGRFSVLSDLTINRIEGYFSTDAGEVKVSLFGSSADGEGGFVPGSMLQSASFATGAGALAWRGVAGLNWAVSKGGYWIVFNASYGNASQASMPGGFASPLDGYALMQAGQWYDAAGLGLDQGLRVDTTAAAVPEPGSMALFGLGLGLIGIWTRRRA